MYSEAFVLAVLTHPFQVAMAAVAAFYGVGAALGLEPKDKGREERADKARRAA